MRFKGGRLRLSASSLFLPALAFYFGSSLVGQTVPPATSPAQSEAAPAPQVPALTQTPASTPDVEEGLIKFDVVVTDRLGKLVPGLKSTDLTLLDNGQPTKILSFHAFDGTSATSDLPVEVILVIDTLRMPGLLASHEREEVEKFLQRNGGRLSHPVSIFKVLDSGLWLVL